MNRHALHYYEFGPFRLNVTEHLLHRGDALVPLTPKVIDTLLVLVENTGHVVEKNVLMQHLWPDSFVEESSLTQNISLLRRALSEGNGNTSYIETIPKRGYRFVAEVREVAETPDEVVAPVVTVSNDSHAVVAVSNEDAHAQPAKKSTLYLAAFSGCLAIALAFGIVYFVRRERARADNFIPKSVAVLPFQTIGAQSESDMLGLGMADALIIKLSKLDHLTVLPTSSVFRFSTRNKDVVGIGKDLGVEGVLDGTVQRDGDWVRVTAQLIRLSDGKTVWSAKFDERYTSLFTLQDSISDQLSVSLRPQVASGKRGEPSTTVTWNTEAYQDYLTGIYFWNRRTKENLPKAIQYLEAATRKDPKFAKAHAMLADCHYLSLTDEYMTSNYEESLQKADDAVKRALELDDTVAEAHTTKAGLLLLHRYPNEAGQSFLRALDLNPNYATAHLRYSYFLYSDLRREAALYHMRRAQELDPVSAVTNAGLAGMLYSSRDYDAAISYARKAIELEPRSFGAYLNMGDAYIQKRMFTEAQQAFDAVLQENPIYVYWEKAYAYALAGRRDEAFKAIAEIEKLNVKRLPAHYNYGLVYGALGDLDQAFASLDKATFGRFRLASLKYDPQFDPLRGDPRFKELLKKYKVE